MRGISKYEIEDYHGAIADFTKTIEFDPNHKDYFKNRGLAKAKIGDLQGACLDAKKSVSLGVTEPSYKSWIKENCKFKS